jgi:hypothetical protein
VGVLLASQDELCILLRDYSLLFDDCAELIALALKKYR